MTEGYERRDLVKDMNASKTRATGRPDTVPLAPVMSPQPSSFTAVGKEKRKLAGLIDSIGVVLGKKQAQEDEQSQLDGKLARAQGMAEKEAKANGEYFYRGYLAMKADNMRSQLLQQGVDDIRAKYSHISTDEYRKIMMQHAVQVESDLGDNDYARKLSATMVSDVLPKLVNEHVRASNEFNKQETRRSYTNLLVNTAANG